MQNKIITVSNPESGKESAEIYKTTNVLLVAFMFRIYVKSSQKMSGLSLVFLVGVSGDTYVCSFYTTKQRKEYL